MVWGVFSVLSFIFFLLAIILLFKSRQSDIAGLIKRKLSLLISLFILVIASFLIAIFIPKVEIIPFFLSLILTFVIFDLDRKITFNKKIGSIRRSIQSKLINPKLEQIKDEESNFEREKLSIEKQKEKIEEMQIKLETQKQDLIEREFELKEKASDLLKLEKKLNKKLKKPKKRKK